MNATESIIKAKEHLALFLPNIESLRIEGVNSKKNGNWLIQISFFDDDAAVPSALLATRNRVYKSIDLDKKGELVSITMITK